MCCMYTANVRVLAIDLYFGKYTSEEQTIKTIKANKGTK